MDIYIRSQDRELLKRYAYNIEITKTIAPNHKKETHGVMLDGVLIGKYNTKERCIEIIDEIQKQIAMSDSRNAFICISHYDSCDDEDYSMLRNQLENARERNFIVSEGDCDVQLIQANVIVYEMPKE